MIFFVYARFIVFFIIKVKDDNKLLFDKILPYPGEFHIMKNYMIVVWDILEGSGIDTALGELYKGASLRSIMNCSHFNKSLRAMKLLHSTLATLLIHEFLNTVPDEIFNDIETIMHVLPLDISSSTCKIEWLVLLLIFSVVLKIFHVLKGF
jgi:hypothetical protein